MKKIFSILFLFVLFGCKDLTRQSQTSHKGDTSRKQVLTDDTLPRTKMLTDEERALRQIEFDKEEKLDSLRLLKVLAKALQYAEQNKHRPSFHHEFEMLPDDTSFTVTTQMVFDKLFDDKRKHLLIRRKVPWGAILNIYLLKDSRFKPVVERVQSGMTYIDDTLKDVNGDNYKDFLVHWYPSAGCCLADIYNVYLYRHQSGEFTSDYEFINPTFSPQEKLIRGLSYGHPGEAGLYKYKWDELRVDTIEFIYQSIGQDAKYIKTLRREYRPTLKEGTLLNALPKEYMKLDSNSLSWFLTSF